MRSGNMSLGVTYVRSYVNYSYGLGLMRLGNMSLGVTYVRSYVNYSYGLGLMRLGNMSLGPMKQHFHICKK